MIPTNELMISTLGLISFSHWVHVSHDKNIYEINGEWYNWLTIMTLSNLRQFEWHNEWNNINRLFPHEKEFKTNAKIKRCPSDNSEPNEKENEPSDDCGSDEDEEEEVDRKCIFQHLPFG